MPIDTSIYQNLKPVEMPSLLDSQQKAASLGSMAMQQQHMAKQMQTEDRDQAFKAHLQKASVFGNTLESLAGMAPQERATMYPKARMELVQSGIIKPEDAPEDYDDGFYRQSLMKYRQSAEGIEKQLKMAQIGKLNAESREAIAKRNPAKETFDHLPPENQEQIKDLAKKNASKTSIKNQIDSALTILDDPEISETQKVTIGQQLLKTLNSSEGADAVGAEESKRLGSLLENKFFNIRQAGSMFGRDVGDFVNQVKLTSGSLGQSLQRNNATVDSLYGRTGRAVSPIDVPEGARVAQKTNEGVAQAADGGVAMYSPKGKLVFVPKDQVGEAIAAGGRRAK